MTDQTLLMTGPSASAFCYGLVDTGKFIRIYPENRPLRRPRLFGSNSVLSRIFSKDTPDKDSNLKNDLKEFPDNTVYFPDDKGEKPLRKPTRPIRFQSPDGEKGYDFAVRGNHTSVTAVLEIIRAHRREFEVAEIENHIIRVNCIGSPGMTKAALDEIRVRL